MKRFTLLFKQAIPKQPAFRVTLCVYSVIPVLTSVKADLLLEFLPLSLHSQLTASPRFLDPLLVEVTSGTHHPRPFLTCRPLVLITPLQMPPALLMPSVVHQQVLFGVIDVKRAGGADGETLAPRARTRLPFFLHRISLMGYISSFPFIFFSIYSIT